MHLTPYQQLIDFYLKLQESYHCLPSDIDRQEVSVIIDELNVIMLKNEAENKVFIDEII